MALECVRRGEGGEIAMLLAGVGVGEEEGLEVVAGRLPSRFRSLMDISTDDENNNVESTTMADEAQRELLQMNIEQAMEQVMDTTKFQPNKSQKDAVKWALQRRISLIRGPPGTGR